MMSGCALFSKSLIPAIWWPSSVLISPLNWYRSLDVGDGTFPVAIVILLSLGLSGYSYDLVLELTLLSLEEAFHLHDEGSFL